jgi:hypothetical protein
MKKYLLILMAIFCISINANAIVWRGTHKVCAKAVEMTLYSSGKMIFWYDGKSYDGKYNIDDGYLNLYENDKKIFSFKYSFNNQTQKLQWVDVGGTRLTRCN